MRHGTGHAVSRATASLDEETLRRAGAAPDRARINFLVPCGTTGESPTLTRDEHLRVVEITVEEAKGKVPVLAGAGGYNTHGGDRACAGTGGAGADGILSVTPYYNKPTQEGLYQHYQAIASAVGSRSRLQRAGPHRRERGAGDAGAAGGDREHRRREGSFGHIAQMAT